MNESNSTTDQFSAADMAYASAQGFRAGVAHATSAEAKGVNSIGLGNGTALSPFDYSKDAAGEQTDMHTNTPELNTSGATCIDSVPLPAPFLVLSHAVPEDTPVYTADQLRAYGDARASAAVAQAGVPEGWRCFHCGEEFTDRDAAALHFGKHEFQDPACLIDITSFREMEALQLRYLDEDADVHRAMHRMQSEHQQALRRAEEAGYAKGLADAVKYPADAMLSAAPQPAAVKQDLTAAQPEANHPETPDSSFSEAKAGADDSHYGVIFEAVKAAVREIASSRGWNSLSLRDQEYIAGRVMRDLAAAQPKPAPAMTDITDALLSLIRTAKANEEGSASANQVTAAEERFIAAIKGELEK